MIVDEKLREECDILAEVYPANTAVVCDGPDSGLDAASGYSLKCESSFVQPVLQETVDQRARKKIFFSEGTNYVKQSIFSFGKRDDF